MVTLVIWHPNTNMYDIHVQPNTYHSMHQIEQVSVSVSSTLAKKKGHERVHENERGMSSLAISLHHIFAVTLESNTRVITPNEIWLFEHHQTYMNQRTKLFSKTPNNSNLWIYIW